MLGTSKLPTVAADSSVRKAEAALATLQRDRDSTARAIEAAEQRVAEAEAASVANLTSGGAYDTVAIDTARHDLGVLLERLERLTRAVAIASDELKTAKAAALERVEAKGRTLLTAAAKDLDRHLSAAADANEQIRSLEAALRIERQAAGKAAWEAAIAPSLSWPELATNGPSETSRLQSWRRFKSQELGVA